MGVDGGAELPVPLTVHPSVKIYSDGFFIMWFCVLPGHDERENFGNAIVAFTGCPATVTHKLGSVRRRAFFCHLID
jgi:hypothetical protein